MNRSLHDPLQHPDGHRTDAQPPKPNGRSERIIAAQGEALAADTVGSAADITMAHPQALHLRNLQSHVEIGVDQNTAVVFAAPLMSTIGELGAFLGRQTNAATAVSSTAEHGSTRHPELRRPTGHRRLRCPSGHRIRDRADLTRHAVRETDLEPRD